MPFYAPDPWFHIQQDQGYQYQPHQHHQHHQHQYQHHQQQPQQRQQLDQQGQELQYHHHHRHQEPHQQPLQQQEQQQQLQQQEELLLLLFQESQQQLFQQQQQQGQQYDLRPQGPQARGAPPPAGYVLDGQYPGLTGQPPYRPMYDLPRAGSRMAAQGMPVTRAGTLSPGQGPAAHAGLAGAPHQPVPGSQDPPALPGGYASQVLASQYMILPGQQQHHHHQHHHEQLPPPWHYSWSRPPAQQAPMPASPVAQQHPPMMSFPAPRPQQQPIAGPAGGMWGPGDMVGSSYTLASLPVGGGGGGGGVTCAPAHAWAAIPQGRGKRKRPCPASGGGGDPRPVRKIRTSAASSSSATIAATSPDTPAAMPATATATTTTVAPAVGAEPSPTTIPAPAPTPAPCLIAGQGSASVTSPPLCEEEIRVLEALGPAVAATPPPQGPAAVPDEPQGLPISTGPEVLLRGSDPAAADGQGDVPAAAAGEEAGEQEEAVVMPAAAGEAAGEQEEEAVVAPAPAGGSWDLFGEDPVDCFAGFAPEFDGELPEWLEPVNVDDLFSGPSLAE